MDILAALFQALAMLLGIYQEHEITREQCADMVEAGAVPYPLTDEQFSKIEQCRELQDDRD